ncbi:MAG: class II fructose-bisphosphate aldolase [Candidatus Shapirobacteria bacterium]
MISLREQFTKYFANHKALPAFNIDSFEIFQAVEMAVSDTQLPCIVQLSANEDSFIEAEKLFLLVKKAQLNNLPIYLNMDHCHDLTRMVNLVKLGFDMVHFDGSSLDYQENLDTATSFIKKLREINPDIVVEVEFNKINLIEKGVNPDSFTTPEQSLEFISTSKADLLAVSIGNLHGVSTDAPENINLELFTQITTVLPNHFFTLHGGSGIPLDQVKSAIRLGIVKININTDLRLAFKKSLLLSINSSPSEKIYDYLQPAIDDVKKVVIEKLTNFGADK